MVLRVVDEQHLGLDLVEIGLGVAVLDRLNRPQCVVGIALCRLCQPALVQCVGSRESRRYFLNAGGAFGAEVPCSGVDVVPRVRFVEAVVPVWVVPNGFGLGAPAKPVGPLISTGWHQIATTPFVRSGYIS